jgi:hypothetical protein
MIQLSRYKGVALVATCVLAAFCLLDMSLTAAVGFTGRWLPNGEYPTDTMVFQAKGPYVAAMTTGSTKVGIGSDTPCGILLGQSPLGCAVERSVLEESDGLQLFWIKLNCWGTSIHGISDLYELMKVADARPNVVVLGINPYLLVGQEIMLSHNYLLKKEGKRIKPFIWFYNNRRMVNYLSHVFYHRINVKLQRAFGFELSALYGIEPDLRRTDARERVKPFTPGELKESEKYDEALGWFDPAKYSPDSSNSRALVKLINDCRERKAKVCIILMPESSAFRNRVPPEGKRCFAEINRRYFAHDPVPVYDLQDRVADDQFVDLVHASIDAMKPFSLVAAECVADFLSGHPSPDRFRNGGKPAASPGARPSL